MGCLGSWISCYKDVGEISDYGSHNFGVDVDKQKVITIVDKDARFKDIYPKAPNQKSAIFLRKHRNLVSDDVFEWCSDLLPRR